VASAIAETTRDNLQRYGHITNQVQPENLQVLLGTFWLVYFTRGVYLSILLKVKEYFLPLIVSVGNGMVDC
jgi:hypothetical protein